MKKVLLVMLLIFSGSITVSYADGDIGEYLKFGDYRGDDVVYYIANKEDINNDGINDYCLISNRILMYKAVDSTTNVWKNTALRQWLNSSDENVKWKGIPPNATFVKNNPYAQEPGFLSDRNISSYERSLILSITHKSIYPQKNGADGGTEDWIWNDGNYNDFRLALQNYDSAYFGLSTDMVFLPSVKELVEMSIPMTVPQAKSAGTNLSGTEFGFLTRDASFGTSRYVRHYFEYNSISHCSIETGNMGIRPMLYLDGKAVISGNGTEESPYYINGGRDGNGVVVKDYSISEGYDELKYNLQLKNRTQEDAEGLFFVALYNNDNKLEKIYHEKVCMTGHRGKNAYISIPKNETINKNVSAFYWDEHCEPLKLHEKRLTSCDEFVLGKNMFFDNPQICISNTGNYGVQNAFDNNQYTVFGISSLNKSSMVFSFEYPATIKSIGLKSVENGDWATIKAYKVLAYNDEQVFRKKTKNPIVVTTINLKNNSDMQTFDLSEFSNLSNITHLVLEPIEVYKTRTGAVWGGFSEIKITGFEDKNEILSQKTAKPKISPNRLILKELGINIKEGVQSAKTIIDIMNVLGFKLPSTSVEEPMSAETFYGILSECMGYDWQEFINMGSAYLLGLDSLTDQTFGIAICEALTLPHKDTGKSRIDELYIAGCIGENIYQRFLDKYDAYTSAHLEDYYVPDGMSSDTKFTFAEIKNPKRITSMNFCYNMPFHYAGGYFGTLPVSNEESKQEEFSKALTDAGVMSLRFPGGLCAHQYFIEGEKYVQKLSRDIRNFGGLYDVYDKNNNTCIDFYDFLDFCKNNAIEPIFQVNTSFYVDKGDDRIYAITKNGYISNTDGSIRNLEYYNHDRIEEAASALGRQIDIMHQKGYNIQYWEIGNEDFSTLNYQHTDLSDENNIATDNYVAISSAFAKVIKERIPNAVVIVTSGFPNLKEKYEQVGVYGLIDYQSVHYPFGSWTSPSSDNRNNLTQLLIGNEQNFVGYSNTDAEYSGDEKMEVCTTETSTWKFESWDANIIQNNFAQALNTAHQWGELVFETPWKISAIHDLESPYYGSVLYNMKYDPETRSYVFPNHSLRVDDLDIPKDYSFMNEYRVNPAGKAIAILANHVNSNVLKPDKTSAFNLISAFASEESGMVILTVVNKTDLDQSIDVEFTNISLPKQTANGVRLSAQTPSAMISREYNEDSIILKVSSGNRLNFSVPGYSISQYILYK